MAVRNEDYPRVEEAALHIARKANELAPHIADLANSSHPLAVRSQVPPALKSLRTVHRELMKLTEALFDSRALFDLES